jgi:hypothetical protein
LYPGPSREWCAAPPQTSDTGVARHTKGGELDFDRWRRDPLLQGFEIGRDVERLHRAEMGKAAVLAPGGEVAGGLRIGFPGVGVADVRGEELKDARRGGGVRLKESGEGESGF